MRLFAAVSFILCLACAGAAPTESERRSRGSRDDDDTGATDTGTTDTADTSNTDSGGNDSGGNDTGRDTGGTDTGGASRDNDSDGWTVAEGDCDDADRRTFPGATESCNGWDDDCDGTIDEGCGGSGTTETYQLAWAGAFRASSSSYTSGTFGVAFVDASGREVCRLTGSMTRQSSAPPSGCTQCDWTFNLSAPTGVTGSGARCADLAAAGYDAAWATSDAGLSAADWSWGFSDTYTYNGETIATNVLWADQGSGWGTWGFEAGTAAGYTGTDGFNVDGTATNFTWSLLTDYFYDVYVAP
jgi:hypothetical protein